jgi:protein-disulfide isomerase
MAKKPLRTKKTATKRETNWLLIGGIVVVGAIAMFALLYLALREPETQSLAEFCDAAEGNCVSYGDANAPVTFVEVSDFGCPHCRNFHREKASIIMEQYVDEGKVRWVFLPYALGPNTVLSATAGLCANEQGKYFEFSSAVFEQEPPEAAITRDGLLAAGEDIGLDMAAFSACVSDGRYTQIVNTNQQAARAARVSSTPSFFVNDNIIRGNLPLEEFERRFNEVLDS